MTAQNRHLENTTAIIIKFRKSSEKLKKIHVYLSLTRYGVLKHEVRALCDVLTDIVTLGREQEVLVGVVGKRRGRRGGH